MIVNGIVIVMVLALGWAWATRGFFSALLNLMAVVVAGAVALGLWEPVSMLVLDLAPSSGLLSFLESAAFAIGLIVPFAATLAIVRVATDAVVRANVNLSGSVDLAGGLACGLGASSIAAGLVVIALGYSGMGSAPLGYKAVDYAESDGRGSLVRTGNLWVPVDRIATTVFGTLSRTTLRTGTPLGVYYPDLDIAGYANMTNFEDGSTRHGLKPDAVSVARTWRVGSPEQPQQARELLSWVDATGGTATMSYVDADGETVNSGMLFGIVLRLEDSAKESTGQVVMSNGQTRLLVRSTSDPSETESLFPVAMISQAGGQNTDAYGRWRFDSPELFVASVDEAARVEMGFEYLVPAGFEPEALYVKNIRLDVEGEPQTFATADQRGAAIDTGRLLSGVTVDLASVDTGDAVAVDRDNNAVLITRNIVRMRFQRNAMVSGFEVNESNELVTGQDTLSSNSFAQQGQSQNILVREFFTPDAVAMVQIDVGHDSPMRFTTDNPAFRNAPRDEPLQLVDDDGTPYPCVGWVNRSGDVIDIRYTPGQTVRSISELPSLSLSEPDEQLVLLFRVTEGSDIGHMLAGDTHAIARIQPPLLVRPAGRR